MIHVHITSLAPTGDALDIVVSHAQAHADFPQPGGCPALAGTVSGNATLVNEQADPSQFPVVVGFVSMPPQGGHDHQDLDQLSTSFVNSGTSVSDTAGAVLASSSTSSSVARGQGICVLPSGGTCTASADAIVSQANSRSGGGRSSSDPSGSAPRDLRRSPVIRKFRRNWRTELTPVFVHQLPTPVARPGMTRIC